MEVRLIKPFGPSVLKTKIPNELVYKLNNYADQIIEDNKKKEILNHGKKLAGDVTQEFRIEPDFAMNVGWVNFLGRCVQEWISLEMKKKINKFNVIDSWIVRQFQNEYNPIHFHGGHISGVGYLKVPVDMGTTVQKEKKVQHNGKLVLIDGSKKFLCNPTYVITPKVGEFYLFPSYMMHTVYPFSDTLEERRSVSFNAKIDDDSAKLR